VALRATLDRLEEPQTLAGKPQIGIIALCGVQARVFGCSML
jgi:hypothetical protein